MRQHCPNAEVVYDLFHVVAKYGREVIDRVRVDEANRLREDKPARRVLVADAQSREGASRPGGEAGRAIGCQSRAADCVPVEGRSEADVALSP